MTNLDSILPTKVRLVKAMVFPVVMYGCESWTIKKAEHRRIDAISSCPQSLPASGSFQMSQLFASGGQSIGASALASVLPMNTQD